MNPRPEPRPRRSRRLLWTITLLLALPVLGCQAGDAESQDNVAVDPVPRVTILEPEDGAELDGRSVLIALGAENIQIAPAGDTLPGTGHHHLFINAPPSNPGDPIPAGIANVVHLGKAQASHELTNLAPGEYMVIAAIGDLVHRRIDPQVMDTVRFRVR